ncbi:hypothetical protein [Candidatus Villigracilis affinis]|uniref:hypothetical protein n=1 Tax=Candidatus Villigracilis affinis TaxID=3140682 RepID=UPI001D647292|nr:hypothetical protein [Anaerolineales bacterium]MBL0347714.1 hypothetical protein [Anaerolineales bacterium]
MKALAYDEKIATVMVYTNSMLVRGDVVAKENVRVSIWLRTQGVPNYIHLHGAQVISFSGGAPKTSSQNEIFIPTVQVNSFHLAPPTHDPLDYDASELNRTMQLANVMVGSFNFKGKMRISTQTDFGTSLDVMRASWASVYDVEITNPLLPQFNLQVPMLLVNPSHVIFGLV